MPREKFIEKQFQASSRKIIEQANAIITEYAAKGYLLTLRQLYYQFVARHLLPNKQREYKRLGSVINDGRLAGLIDWRAIEDRTRNLRGNQHWRGSQDFIDNVAASFRNDIWATQPVRVEVWIEKDALSGIFAPVCVELDVDYFACRGYTSQSEQWRAGRRFRMYRGLKQRVVVLHFGDHDPSGIDMTRDNDDRLQMLSGGAEVEIRRLALNMDQIERYQPPPNPAKMTDSRFGDYSLNYGSESWELDALDPTVIGELIRTAVAELVDAKKMARAKKKQEGTRAELRRVASQWPAIIKGLQP